MLNINQEGINFVLDLQKIANLLQRYSDSEGLSILAKYNIQPNTISATSVFSYPSLETSVEKEKNIVTPKKSPISTSTENISAGVLKIPTKSLDVVDMNGNKLGSYTTKVPIEEKEKVFTLELSHDNSSSKYILKKGDGTSEEKSFAVKNQDFAELTALQGFLKYVNQEHIFCGNLIIHCTQENVNAITTSTNSNLKRLAESLTKVSNNYSIELCKYSQAV